MRYVAAALAFAAILAPGSTASVSSRSGGGDVAFPAGGFYMDFWVLYDDAFVEGFGSDAINEINALFDQLRGIFSHGSLGTTIEPRLKGTRKVGGRWSATGQNLNNLKAHVDSANEYPDVNAYVMLSYTDGRSLLGIAKKSSTCAKRKYRVSIGEHNGDRSYTAGLLAHEIGHNLGMSHDGPECGGNGYMTAGGRRNHWSSCSRAKFFHYYKVCVTWFYKDQGFCLKPRFPQKKTTKMTTKKTTRKTMKKTTTTTTTAAPIDCKNAINTDPNCEKRKGSCVYSPHFLRACPRTCVCDRKKKKEGCYDEAKDMGHPRFCRTRYCKGRKKQNAMIFCKDKCGLCE